MLCCREQRTEPDSEIGVLGCSPRKVWTGLLHLELEERWLGEAQSASRARRYQSLGYVAKTKRAIAKGRSSVPRTGPITPGTAKLVMSLQAAETSNVQATAVMAE